MASEQSQRAQTLRYQSNTTFLIGPNASSVPGGSMLPGLLQPSSQSAITAPNGHAWPSQPPPGLAAEQPPIATVEASEILQVGSNTTVAPPPQPPRYAAPTTLRRSHMTTSLTELSPVGGTGTVAAGSSLGPVGSLGSVPPAPSTSTMPYAPTVPGWAGRGPPGSLLRRPNMPVMDAHGFGSSAGSIMTTASRQPYFATSMTEAPGSVAISSVGVIECPSPRNSLAGMPPASRPLRSPPPRRSLSPGQLSTRPPPMGRRFAPPYGEEIRRRPPSGVDFLDQDRIDEGYDSVETVGGRRDSHPPLSRLPASNVDFRYRERIDEGYDSTETVSRQPAPRRLEPTVSRSGRRQMNASSRPVAGSKSGSGPHVSRIRMFQIERDRGAAPAEAETRKLTYETHDGTHDVSSAASHGQPYQPQLSDIPDDSSYDDYGPSRPRVCNCPGTVMIRRGPPRRSTSGRLRGAYIRNDDDDDVMDDLYMIKMSKKKKKRKQPPPPPVAPAPSGGLLGFLSGLVGGRQPPPPPPRQADSDSDDESDFELRRFDRRQLENLVRRMEMKQAASEDESKEGRKAKKQEEKKPEENKSEEKKPEEKKPEEEKPEDKPPEPEKKEEKPPEAQAQAAAAPATPGAPAKPATPAAPGATPAKPATPAAPGAPAKPATPTAPGAPAKPATPTAPGAPAKPATPTAPGAAAKTATPAAPGAAAKPGTPTAPGAPAKPGTPTAPGAAAKLVTPTAPGAPAKPATPAAPGAAAKPATPAAPGAAAKPATPAAPGAAAKPPTPTTAAPGAPAKPTTPTPAAPAAPGAPAKPTTPAAPAAPGAPAKPATPTTPAAPGAAAPMAPLDVKVPVVFVFGGPGSGKGTQCDKIVAKYGFTHISSGDLLRAEVASGSDRGKQIDDIMKQGALAPLTMILQLIKETMQKDLPTAKGFLLDGYPRNVEQGERFEAEVCKCTNLIYFEVSDDTMKARILKRGQTSGRVDDNADTAVKRIKTFHDESQPVLDKYKDIVHKISAEDDPDKVFASVSAVMDEMLKPK